MGSATAVILSDSIRGSTVVVVVEFHLGLVCENFGKHGRIFLVHSRAKDSNGATLKRLVFE